MPMTVMTVSTISTAPEAWANTVLPSSNSKAVRTKPPRTTHLTIGSAVRIGFLSSARALPLS